MDAISGGNTTGAIWVCSTSGDYNQREYAVSRRVVLLPTSATLTRGIWEINRGKILVLTVTVFKNIQEHSMKFKFEGTRMEK